VWQEVGSARFRSLGCTAPQKKRRKKMRRKTKWMFFSFSFSFLRAVSSLVQAKEELFSFKETAGMTAAVKGKEESRDWKLWIWWWNWNHKDYFHNHSRFKGKLCQREAIGWVVIKIFLSDSPIELLPAYKHSFLYGTAIIGKEIPVTKEVFSFVSTG